MLNEKSCDNNIYGVKYATGLAVLESVEWGIKKLRALHSGSRA